jgi:hypothetical protein
VGRFRSRSNVRTVCAEVLREWLPPIRFWTSNWRFMKRFWSTPLRRRVQREEIATAAGRFVVFVGEDPAVPKQDEFVHDAAGSVNQNRKTD